MRDLDRNTFTFESAYHSTLPLAQNWLIERGCPAASISRVGTGFIRPADEATVLIEDRLRTSGDRYEVLDSYTSDVDPAETWTLARDTTAVWAPIRVFLEEADLDTDTYTLREGAFVDEDSARQWLDNRSGPLPQPSELGFSNAALRTQAALARSSAAVTTRGAGSVLDVPAAVLGNRPGRSI